MKILLCLFACLLFVACGGDTQQADSQSTADVDAQSTVETAGDDNGHSHDGADGDSHAHDVAVAAGTYPVACGCSIESVGHCGNYIEVAGDHYEIANSEEQGLGGMEWCGKAGVTVVAEGEIEDGKFVAASLTVQ